MKHIVIGGVAGGATAAARLRRADEFAEIILLEKGKNISYANCGLPYYIGGTIEDRDQLFVQTPESFGGRFNIDVRVDNEAIEVDSAEKTVKIRRANGSTYTETYDKLLLSPGAAPARPPIKGIDSEGIFVLRNVVDTDKIKSYIRTNEIKSAVVVGAGFIGLEMAENLAHIGANVSIVEMASQVMTPIDFSMATHVHQHLLEKGVNLYLENAVQSFRRNKNTVEITFKNGQTLEADIVILSIGVRPEVQLAKDTGIKLGETGGIWVDEYLETSIKDIYAVGDAIEYPHPITGKPWMNYLANPANRQGRIVADNMILGNKTSYEGAIGTSIAKVFDLTVGSTGLPVKRLRQLEMPFATCDTHSGSHAGYYPNSLPVSFKLTFHPKTGVLYGAQGVGYDGIDKRIDQVALLIKKGGTIYDLIKLEHTYAPPFSSAKDPIAIAGYVANNIINGDMPVVTWKELRELDKQDTLIIDVRTAEEFEFGAIHGAVNIPLDEIRGRLSEIPRNKHIYLYCAVGLRGYLAQKILRARGFEYVKNLSGGYKTYATATAPVKEVSPRILPSSKHHTHLHRVDSGKKQENTLKIDACGLQCPGPILRLKNAMDEMQTGQRIEVLATDPGFSRDADAWCNTTGNILISNSSNAGKVSVVIEKGGDESCKILTSCDGRGKTFIMFSDDLDKALATFVLANGAAATGRKVTIFFTFWGLNTIKKTKKPKVSKDIFGKMFGMMLPSSSLKLKLSKMNMFGAGSRMMRYIMRKKGIDSLESLRQQAIEQGVEFIACQMSMDVMGVSKEELIDEASIGGVATYMERAEDANVNLFI